MSQSVRAGDRIGGMKPRFSILTLLTILAVSAAILSWQDYGWYALMVGITLTACLPQSGVSYFARGLLFGCVLFQVLIGIDEGNILGRQFNHTIDPMGGSIIKQLDKAQQLRQLVSQVVQLVCGSAFGLLALWRYRVLARREKMSSPLN
jgi:hypothetical protein